MLFCCIYFDPNLIFTLNLNRFASASSFSTAALADKEKTTLYFAIAFVSHGKVLQI